MLLSFEICVTHAQLPDGRLIALGLPESIAYVPIATLFPPDMLVVVVCSPVVVGVVDHCLYVGVPKAELVFREAFK